MPVGSRWEIAAPPSGFNHRFCSPENPATDAQLKMAYPMDITEVVLIGLAVAKRKDIHASRFEKLGVFPFGNSEEFVSH